MLCATSSEAPQLWQLTISALFSCPQFGQNIVSCICVPQLSQNLEPSFNSFPHFLHIVIAVDFLSFSAIPPLLQMAGLRFLTSLYNWNNPAASSKNGRSPHRGRNPYWRCSHSTPCLSRFRIDSRCTSCRRQIGRA